MCIIYTKRKGVILMAKKATINVPAVIITMAKQKMDVNDIILKGGISRKTMQNIFDGVGTPRPKTIGKLAEVLNVDVTAIISWE